MTTSAQQIAAFAAALRFSDLPTSVVDATKLHILDVLGCGVAADALGVGDEGRSAMHGLGEGDATVIGSVLALPAPNAAFANAMLCHALDFDDTHSGSVCHISVAVVPAAMAVAESNRVSGRELLTGIVAGTETVARVGLAAPGAFHKRGFHPTSVCGVFGAAVAAARLNKLTAEATSRALGIAGSMSSGLLAYLDDGSPTKPIHAAWAAHGGIIAARLSAHGAGGPAGVLDGRFGLMEAFIDNRNADIKGQVEDLGTRWETENIALKAFPACHYMHGSLAATASISDKVSVHQIEEIRVTVPKEAVPIVLEPSEHKAVPHGDYAAKFSLQYSTASMLLNGQVNLQTYSATARADRTVQALARKVSYEVKKYATTPAAFPGGVSIRTTDGSLVEADFPYQLGAPENPMSADQVRQKFRDNASLSLDAESVADLEDSICALEVQEDLAAVFAPLRRRKA